MNRYSFPALLKTIIKNKDYYKRIFKNNKDKSI